MEGRHNTHSHDTFVRVQLITARTAQVCHSRNTRGSRLRIAVSLKQLVIPASCLTCCRTCHRTLLHDLSHLHHLSSDHLLPHCPVLPRSIQAWIMKPCETHGRVADTLNLHLPQDKAEEYAASPWQCDLALDGNALLLPRSAAMQDENPIGSLKRKMASGIHRQIEALAAVQLLTEGQDQQRRILLSATGAGAGSEWAAVPTMWADWLNNDQYLRRRGCGMNRQPWRQIGRVR